ncbi:unnamed protein product [Sphacelaria rigidula]
MLGFGRNDRGQLGLEGNQARASPEPQRSIDAVLIQVACGYYHTAVLTEAGDVLTVGRNDYGQLGLGHVEDIT